MTMSYATALHMLRTAGRNRGRKHRRRIDYYPSADALRAIEALTAGGSSLCGAINKLVESAEFRNGTMPRIQPQNQRVKH